MTTQNKIKQQIIDLNHYVINKFGSFNADGVWIIDNSSKDYKLIVNQMLFLESLLK